jgi:hypothetical protein
LSTYETASTALELKDGKQAISILEKCLKEFSASARKPEFLLALARAYLVNGVTERPVSH